MRYGTFLQNAEKLPRHTGTHTPQLHLWENDLRCASYTPPCARPLRAAASSCRTFARRLCPSRARRWRSYADTLRLLNGPLESPPSPSGNSERTHSAQPAELYYRYPSPTTVGQHCGNSGELCPYSCGSYGGQPVLNQIVDESSLTVFSIIKYQKIVNT